MITVFTKKNSRLSFSYLKDAFDAAKKNPAISKIEFNTDTGERICIIRKDNEGYNPSWFYEPEK